MGRNTRMAGTALSLLAACGGGSPGEGTRVCRRYASSLLESGQSYQCAFEGRSLTCRSGSVVASWDYDSASDFVREAQVPNRILALTRSLETSGMVVTSSLTRTEYRFDGSERLVERRRTRSDVAGRRELDLVGYTAWDALGRPTAGLLQSPDGSGPVTLVYDDSARRMDTSNGESVTRDADGNVVREVVVIGFGAPAVVEHAIQATTELCL